MAFNDIGSAVDQFAPSEFLFDRSRARPRGLYARFGKRLVDIVLSLLMLPVLLPVIGVLWLVIRRDGNAALFCQPRVGRNGRVFTCYKFRTMVPDAERVLAQMCARDPAVAAEWNKFQKLCKDPRITKIGAILRKTSLDELPQIFNVLKGDMSLVGPRPFMPSQDQLYRDCGGHLYYQMRPGVTGMWQILSRHDTTFASRVRFDETYGTELSLMGDLSLILRTAKVVLKRTGV